MRIVPVKTNLSPGVLHEVPTDMEEALTARSGIAALWNALTPIQRNEWICWTVSVKTPEIRKQHVARVCSELKEGMRRPCCWIGYTHRKDKALSRSQKFILGKRSKTG